MMESTCIDAVSMAMMKALREGKSYSHPLLVAFIFSPFPFHPSYALSLSRVQEEVTDPTNDHYHHINDASSRVTKQEQEEDRLRSSLSRGRGNITVTTVTIVTVTITHNGVKDMPPPAEEMDLRTTHVGCDSSR